MDLLSGATPAGEDDVEKILKQVINLPSDVISAPERHVRQGVHPEGSDAVQENDMAGVMLETAPSAALHQTPQELANPLELLWSHFGF
jgi:hypothetical protein